MSNYRYYESSDQGYEYRRWISQEYEHPSDTPEHETRTTTIQTFHIVYHSFGIEIRRYR